MRHHRVLFGLRPSSFACPLSSSWNPLCGRIGSNSPLTPERSSKGHVYPIKSAQRCMSLWSRSCMRPMLEKKEHCFSSAWVRPGVTPSDATFSPPGLGAFTARSPRLATAASAVRRTWSAPGPGTPGRAARGSVPSRRGPGPELFGATGQSSLWIQGCDTSMISLIAIGIGISPK